MPNYNKVICFNIIMGRKGGLANSEKSTITNKLVKENSTLEIPKIIERYYETVKNFVKDLVKVGKRAD